MAYWIMKLAVCFILQGQVVGFRPDQFPDAKSLGSMVQESKILEVPVGHSHHHHEAADVTHNPHHNKEVHVPWYMLPIAACFVAAIILFLYGPSGTSVVLSVLVYLFALATIKLSVKFVFQTHAYPFPKFVSATHFVAGGLVTFCVLKQRGVPIPVPTAHEFLAMICPIALALSLSIGLNNMALVFSSAAFTEIVGATNCLVTIAMVMLMGMPFDPWLILPVSIVAFGCALGSLGEANFSLVGFALCFGANIFRSAKVTMQQKLLTGETKDKFDPTALLFWGSFPSIAAMMFGSFVSEGMKPYVVLTALAPAQLHGLVLAILLSCVNAVILNLAQLHVIKHLGAVGGQLVAQAKMVLTVLGGMVLFGESFAQLESVGFGVTLVGVYIFARMDQAFNTKEKSKQEAHKSSFPLPGCASTLIAAKASGGK